MKSNNLLKALMVLVLMVSVVPVSVMTQDAVAEVTPPAEPPAEADDDKFWGVELTSDFYSEYVWRGILLTDGWVWQPSATLSMDAGPGTFSIGAWGNLDMEDVNDNEGEFNEVDYYASYGYSFGEDDFVSIEHGLILYDFPNTDFDSTWEVYTSVGLGLPLSPTLSVYYDFDEAEGFYTTFDVSHSLPFTEDDADVGVSLDLSALVSYSDSDFNEFYHGVDDSGFHDVTLGLSLPVTFGNFSISPAINYSKLIDSDIEDSAGSDDENVWVGVGIGFEF